MTEQQQDLHQPHFWWFEKHPAKIIILYTLTIVTISFASAYYLLDDRKDLLHKVQLDLKQVQIDSINLYVEQYKARIDFLAQENKDLQTENQLFYTWLSENPTTIQYLKGRILSLEHTLAEGSNINDSLLPKVQKPYLNRSGVLRVGSAFVDDLTGATVGISNITVSNTAIATMFVPPNTQYTHKEIRAGQRWDFPHKDQKFSLIVTKVDFITDTFAVEVREL